MSEVNNVLNKLCENINKSVNNDQSLMYTYNIISKQLIDVSDEVIIAYLIDLLERNFKNVHITYKSVNSLNFIIKLDDNFDRLYAITVRNAKIDLFISMTHSDDFYLLFKSNLVSKNDYNIILNHQSYGHILFKKDEKVIKTILDDIKLSKSILEDLKIDL